jgi:hypothetical protein
MVGVLRRLQNEELHNLYASPNIIRVIISRRMRWEENVARMGEMRNTYKILVGKPVRKRPLVRRIRTNIRMDHREMRGGVGGCDIHVKCLRKPRKTLVRMYSISAETERGYFMNTSQMHYRCSNLLG